MAKEVSEQQNLPPLTPTPELLDSAVTTLNGMTIIGIGSYALGSVFEAKGLADFGGILAVSGLVLNGLARGARALVNFRHPKPQA